MKVACWETKNRGKLKWSPEKVLLAGPIARAEYRNPTGSF